MPGATKETLKAHFLERGTAEIFTELRMEKSLHPVGPLLEGKWE